MAFTIGSGTFTNGSATVTAVTLTSGTLAYFASGTRMVVGVNPVVQEVEAIAAPTVTTITLRSAWTGTGGTYSFLANQTSEGLRDAVQAIRTNNASLQSFIDSIDTAPTNNSVAQRDASGQLIATNVIIADKIIHDGDTNTAIRFPAADTVTVETNGAERLRVGSSGNVGIGESSPIAKLQVNGSIASSDHIAFYANTSTPLSSNFIYRPVSNSLAFGTNSTERLRIDSSGNVGIGTSSPSGLLDVRGGDAFINDIRVGRGAGGISTNAVLGAGPLNNNTTGVFNSAFGNGALRDNTTGETNAACGSFTLTRNTTGNSNTAVGVLALDRNTTGNNNTGLGRTALERNASGSNNIGIGFEAGTATSPFTITSQNDRIVMGNNSHTDAYIKIAWTVTSDARDKTNFQPVPHGLDFVNQLEPVAYQFRVDRESDETTEKVRYGFKAQDILALEGDTPVVIDNEDPEHLKYKGEALVPILVNAIKELTERLEKLENKK